ncbi:MAG: IS1182 family transposase [Deltaproteobacteria bacterium]|nr:IS1182 family transposase [Deltaproteobacteria bacterium]
MEKQYRPWLPRHPLMFPPSPTDWLAADHLAYFILDLVEQLDLSEIDRAYQVKDHRGERPYHPRMMTALLLYAYCTGEASSRKIEQATSDDVAMRVLAGGEHPDHTRISEFRRKHLNALRTVWVQVLRFCRNAGLVKLGHVALDGTKVKANASKHKAMSYERMLKNDAELAAEIDALLHRAEETDRAEDAEYGKDRRGNELPDELARRETRRERIREGLAKLQAEAAAARARELAERAEEAEAAGKAGAAQKRSVADGAAKRAQEKAEGAGISELDLSPRDPETLPSHQVQTDAEGNPHPKAQRNFTDPDSRIMKQGGDYVQGYNCQAAVDAESQVIVAQAVTNQPPDCEHLIPMMLLVASECGLLPKTATADNGYYSDANAAWCAERGVDAHLATGRLEDDDLTQMRTPLDKDAGEPADGSDPRRQLHSCVAQV